MNKLFNVSKMNPKIKKNRFRFKIKKPYSKIALKGKSKFYS